MSEWVDNERQVVLAECYVAAPNGGELRAAAARARAACLELTSAGSSVEYLGTLFVAADEAAFHIFAAPDAEAVMEAGRRAGLRVERIVQAVAMAATPSRTSEAQPLSVGGEVEGAVGHPSGELGP
ncbi:MAG: hypothetical protein ABI622_10410 [Chloroflexota bacterium]